MRQAVRYLPVFLFGCGLLGAAPAAPSPRSLRFAVFADRPISDLALAPSAGASPQKLVFHATARSPRYAFRGTMPLRFTDGAGKAVVETTIPPEVTEALLVFSALEISPASGLRYQVTVLDDGASHHGAGSLAVVNLSGLDLSGNIGRHAVLLQAGVNPTLSIGHSARIALRAAAKGKTHPAYDDSVVLGPGQRALLILLPPYEKDSFEVRSRVLIDDPPAGPGGGQEQAKGPR